MTPVTEMIPLSESCLGLSEDTGYITLTSIDSILHLELKTLDCATYQEVTKTLTSALFNH